MNRLQTLETLARLIVAEQTDPERYARRHVKSQAGQQTLHFESAAPTGRRAWTAEDERKHPRESDGTWTEKDAPAVKAAPRAAEAKPADDRQADHVQNLHDAMQEALGRGKQFLARHAGRPLWISSEDHLRVSDDRQTIEHTDPDGKWVSADLAQLDHWADRAGVQPFTGPEGILTKTAQDKAALPNPQESKDGPAGPHQSARPDARKQVDEGRPPPADQAVVGTGQAGPAGGAKVGEGDQAGELKGEPVGGEKQPKTWLELGGLINQSLKINEGTILRPKEAAISRIAKEFGISQANAWRAVRVYNAPDPRNEATRIAKKVPAVKFPGDQPAPSAQRDTQRPPAQIHVPPEDLSEEDSRPIELREAEQAIQDLNLHHEPDQQEAIRRVKEVAERHQISANELWRDLMYEPEGMSRDIEAETRDELLSYSAQYRFAKALYSAWFDLQHGTGPERYSESPKETRESKRAKAETLRQQAREYARQTIKAKGFQSPWTDEETGHYDRLTQEAERLENEVAAEIPRLAATPQHMSEQDFLDYHKTGSITPSSYDRDMGIGQHKIEDHPVLLHRFPDKTGRTIELRQSGKPLNYWAYSPDGDMLCDERGMAKTMTSDEIKAFGLPAHDTTVVAFADKTPIGYASNEFGTDGVWVSPEEQRKGIGTTMLTHFRKQFRPDRKIGQMTPAGEAMARSYHRSITRETPSTALTGTR